MRIFPDHGPESRRLRAMPLLEVTIFTSIGVLSGLIGGLLGIGGSTIFIPAATLVRGEDQQVYQAAAMILNVVVASTATLKHRRSGILQRRSLAFMVVPASLMVIVGVGIGNRMSGAFLAQLFGGLLLLLAISESRSLVLGWKRTEPPEPGSEEKESSADRPFLLTAIGGTMGILGGLLGIGGGTVGVPALRFLARFPLRHAIACAAAVTIPLALIGAVYKNLSLASLPGEEAAAPSDALKMAAALVPGAIAGSWLGATMVHRLPLRAIRLAFLGLLVFAGTRMLGLH